MSVGTSSRRKYVPANIEAGSECDDTHGMTHTVNEATRQDLGLATACVAALGLIAILGLAFARETRGQPLPTDSTYVPSTEKSPS